MGSVVEQNDIQPLSDATWLRDARSRFDAGAKLTAALTPAWTVEREFAPCGDLSLIVLPACAIANGPTFVLYEADGLVQVSTFLGEDWKHRRAFRTCRRAVAAIIATACRANAPATATPNTARTPQARSTHR